MPTYARSEIVADDEVGIYHCINRTVRRAWLCGDDPVSGRSYEHRKDWVRERLKELAGIFAIDVCAYAVMSNHLHVILRTRPDVAEAWSDEEVARRWWRLFPRRKNKDGSAAEPVEHELAMIQADTEAFSEKRKRLSNLSWLMRCLSERIARQANEEDDCTGRFWEGRFRSQRLLDETALLACMIYVDLNPVRAKIAETPEDSDFTSGQDRIQGHQVRAAQKKKRGRPPKNLPMPDRWLSPIELPEVEPQQAVNGGNDDCVGQQNSTDSVEAFAEQHSIPNDQSAGLGELSQNHRKGLLRMSEDDYLRLLDWSGRALHPSKRGSIPSDLAPILERLEVNSESWLDCIQNFGRWFRRAAGKPRSLEKAVSKSNRHSIHGMTRAKQAFTL
jgi:REP element-mobilizing transposase RayT